MSDELHHANGFEIPGVNDVLCGRGKGTMSHSGNKYFNQMVEKYREASVLSKKSDKIYYAKLIIENLKNLSPPGKFLKWDSATKLWYELDHEKSLAKTRQALREGATELLYKLQITTRLSYELDYVKSLAKTRRAPRDMHGEGVPESFHELQNTVNISRPEAQRHEKKAPLNLVSGIQGMHVPFICNPEVTPLHVSSDEKRNTQVKGNKCTSGSTSSAIADKNIQTNGIHATKYSNNLLGEAALPVSKKKDSTPVPADNCQGDKDNDKEVQLLKLVDMINSGISIVSMFESNKVDISVSKVKQLKQIALTKAQENKWKESHDILLNICDFERKLYTCKMKNCILLDLADTLHHLGVARNQLGNTDLALASFTESLTLNQKLRSDAFGAVPTILSIAKIRLKGKKGDIEGEVYKLLMSQLAQHKNSKSHRETISHILRQFECALEALECEHKLDQM